MACTAEQILYTTGLEQIVAMLLMVMAASLDWSFDVKNPISIIPLNWHPWIEWTFLTNHRTLLTDHEVDHIYVITAIPLTSAAEKFKCKTFIHRLWNVSQLSNASHEQQNIKTWKGSVQTQAVGKNFLLAHSSSSETFYLGKQTCTNGFNIEIHCHSLWRFRETVWRQNETKL